MTFRGSFVTEYIYCERCLEAAKAVLLNESNDKYLTSVQIPSWSQNEEKLPIIAGKIGGAWPGVEIFTIKDELIPELEKKICHPMRIAVIAESGPVNEPEDQMILTAFPTVKEIENDSK